MHDYQCISRSTKAETLDNYLMTLAPSGPIDLLKIHVQGDELAVLHGANTSFTSGKICALHLVYNIWWKGILFLFLTYLKYPQNGRLDGGHSYKCTVYILTKDWPVHDIDFTIYCNIFVLIQKFLALALRNFVWYLMKGI